MKILIQRVSEAAVTVDDRVIGQIGPGLVALLGVEREDTEAIADRLLEKMLNYRIFADAEGKMNVSVRAMGGAVLLISQFTLASDTGKGLRPSFSAAAAPPVAERLYLYCLDQLKRQHGQVASGLFGADMKVALTNDGPVTFLLEG
jgi:D-tyrosyl-tRNA(Tyr) deacylase